MSHREKRKTMKQRYDTLDIRIIHRPGELNAKGIVKRSERFTVDFLVNGQSLYELLCEISANCLDMLMIKVQMARGKLTIEHTSN